MAKKSLVKGAAVLAVAGIVVKVLGAFFRIPLGNMIGAEGMANYSPAYSLYAFMLVFATAGLPVAISKMVSERCATGQFREAERVFKISRTLMMIIGVIGFCLLFFFSDTIAELVKVPGFALSMKATAPALLLVPIMSSYRGYFQGMQEMVPTAVSQVVEQIFRVFLGLAAAWILYNSATDIMGFTNDERGAAGGCFGASAGAVGGLVTMMIIYMIARKGIKRRIRNDRTREWELAGSILKKIAVIAIPITIGATIMPLVNLIDAAIVNIRLLDAGFDESAAETMYGQLTGFAEPLIAFPQVIMTSIVLSLVPMVSAAHRLRNYQERNNTISLGMRMAMIIAFPCAAGMFSLAGPILLLLYPTQRASALNTAPTLQTLCVSFVFLAVITTMTGALQGIGKQVVPVINLFLGVIVKFGVTWVMTAVPQINIIGAALGTTVAYVIAATLDFAALKKFTGFELKPGMTIFRPLAASAVMGVIVAFAYKGLFALLGSNSISVLLSVVAGVCIYGVMILKIKAISREELMEVPAGKKIAAVCDKLRLW